MGLGNSNQPSLAWRGALALLLMVMFYALGAGAIFLLVKAGLGLLGQLGHRGSMWIAVGGGSCLVAAAVLAWSLLPRWDRFVAPGPELFEANEPRLFAEIHALSRAAGQAPPDHVYAVLDMNAFVTQRGGILGFGSRRVMGLGIPLMQSLTVAEIRAVIAHELGHFHGGDTKLGPWVYKTRGAMMRAVDNLGGAAKKSSEVESGLLQLFTWVMLAVRKPFIWFGQGFMRITQAVSRRQEIAADELACRIVGSEALATGLERSAGAHVGYQLYLRNEVSPLLGRGVRPPIVEGFARFLDVPRMRTMMDEAARQQLEHEAPSAYDSHPPLAQRVAAARALAEPTREPDDRPAATLLAAPAALEAEALADDVRAMPPVAWHEVGGHMLKSWHEGVARWREALVGLTAATWPFDGDALHARLLRVFPEAHGVSGDDLRSWGVDTLFPALALRLVAAGYEVSAEIGEPAMFRRGERCVDLMGEVRRRATGELDHAAWVAWLGELGVADAPLV